MSLRQENFSNPNEGDKNINIAGKDLRSRLSTFLNILIVFTIVFGLISLIASLVMSSIVYNKHEDKLGDEKNLALWTPITCGIGFILLLIFIIVFYLSFNPKLEAEDRFLTSMTRVATEPASAEDIRSSFGDYLNSALKTKKFGPEDVRKFGNLLASKQETLYKLGEENIPSYLQDRLGRDALKTQEIVREARKVGSQQYLSGFRAGQGTLIAGQGTLVNTPQ